MGKKNLIIWILVSITFTSCEEEFNWKFDNNPSDLVVVEAVLTNEKIPHLIKLNRPYQEQNLEPEAISGALVEISTTDDVYIALEQPIGSGMYYTDSIRAVSGKDYKLTILYNSKTYTATASQPPVEPLATTNWYRQLSDGMYTINLNPFGGSPNYIKYMIDWQSIGDCPVPIDCQALQIYYDLKNADINEEFKPKQEQVTFPLGTIITRKKYSVSDDYQAFLRGMLSETAWRGGIFDAYPANPPTNLSEGAIGFFAVSTVLTETNIVK